MVPPVGTADHCTTSDGLPAAHHLLNHLGRQAGSTDALLSRGPPGPQEPGRTARPRPPGHRRKVVSHPRPRHRPRTSAHGEQGASHHICRRLRAGLPAGIGGATPPGKCLHKDRVPPQADRESALYGRIQRWPASVGSKRPSLSPGSAASSRGVRAPTLPPQIPTWTGTKQGLNGHRVSRALLGR
ncbi:hypothetical protein NDU88_002309 [Pleurodeles waltl]|uniref:Uncharacterized protein n=1 Tax=Pleurodeles waltl TaxID=8319 RepID=A0AAV7MM95_PLEWA|nr:hypothetical protein NDU88_002309 [Pleurodeles waltl]